MRYRTGIVAVGTYGTAVNLASWVDVAIIIIEAAGGGTANIET